MKKFSPKQKLIFIFLIIMITASFFASFIFLYPIINSKKMNTQNFDIDYTIETLAPTEKPQQFLYTEECNINSDNPIYAPITKTESLESTYIPKVVNTDLPGGRQIQEYIKEDLTNLFNLAKQKGLNLQIVSGYRSFATQKSIFNSYVRNEQAKNSGITLEKATQLANIYSAKPGHSEHQLGTTVDITCIGCTPFTFSQQNLEVYEFLEKNINDFGFVISYPKDTAEITGYKYEPWHIRHIGKDLALKYKDDNIDKSPKQPLQEFLKGICTHDSKN